MHHIAIDLGSRESQICVRNSTGKIVCERKEKTRALGAFLATQPHSRVILETCAEAFKIADQVLELGHEVRVVPATLAPTLGVGARGLKTDVRDGRALSEASCLMNLPSVHIPSSNSRDLKARCTVREAMVDARTKLVNNVRGWLRGQVASIASGSVETFPERVRQALLESPEGYPVYLEHSLTAIEALTTQILTASKELKVLAARNDLTSRMMSVPGVGSVTSLRYMAAVDDLTRFSSASALQSYLGLTPGEDSSSLRRRRTGLTKAGPRKVRWALTQAAVTAMRTRPNDPMVKWALEISKRRGKQIAVMALARKIAGILFAIWRDGSSYEPNHVARRNKEVKPPR